MRIRPKKHGPIEGYFEEVKKVFPSVTLADIHSNPAMANTAKSILNSLWGKYTQRPNLPQRKTTTSWADTWKIVQNPKNDIHDFTLSGTNSIIVKYMFTSLL